MQTAKETVGVADACRGYRNLNVACFARPVGCVATVLLLEGTETGAALININTRQAVEKDPCAVCSVSSHCPDGIDAVKRRGRSVMNMTLPSRLLAILAHRHPASRAALALAY